MKKKVYQAPSLRRAPLQAERNFCAALYPEGENGLEGWNWDSDETDWELK